MTPAQISAAIAERKKAYWDNKGKPKTRHITLSICDVCRTHLGTFARGQKGQLVHVGCPGPRPETPAANSPTQPRTP